MHSGSAFMYSLPPSAACCPNAHLFSTPMHADSDDSGSGAGDDSDWSDLEDFIVCKPDRDYSKLFDRRFGYKGGSSRGHLEEGE